MASTTTTNTNNKSLRKSKTLTLEEAKNKTIVVSLSVISYYQADVDYDRFLNDYMDDQRKDETDTDYEHRCKKAWTLLVNNTDGAYDCDQIDEEQCYNEETDALQNYDDANAEFMHECRRAIKLADKLANKD